MSTNGVVNPMPPVGRDPLTDAPNVESPAATTLPAVRAAKLGGVDWLRILAITAVAYYHAQDIWYPGAAGAEYAFAGLHALTAASTYFACASRSAQSDLDLIAKRAGRLLLPWLVFSVPFTLKAIHSGKFRTSMLWVGGATHLWFLPFIFVVGCAIGLAARRGLIVRSLGSAIGWAIVSIAAMAIEPYVGVYLRDKIEPTWQVVNALPSALMGIAIFAVPIRRGDLPMLSALTGAGIAVWWTMPATVHAVAWPAAAVCGAVAFGVARFLPIRSTPASAFVGRASFGVYLIHILALMGVIHVVARLTHANSAGLTENISTLMIVAQVVLAIIASLAIVAVLERTPLRRFVV